MKKGFTLIELLAVIIILAIVALIATPIILDVIDEAQESANLSQVYLLVDGAEQLYANSFLDTSDKLQFSGTDNIDVYTDLITTGEKPEIGDLYIRENGDIYLKVIIDNNCYLKEYDTSEIVKCNIEDGDGNSVTGSYKPSITALSSLEIVDFSKWYQSSEDVVINSFGYDYKYCLSDVTTICEPNLDGSAPISAAGNHGKNLCVNLYSDGKLVSNDCGIILVDDNNPTISPKSESETIMEGQSKLVSSFFDVDFGNTGGEVVCDYIETSVLTKDEHDVKCTAVSNSKKEASATIKIIVTDLVETPIECFNISDNMITSMKTTSGCTGLTDIVVPTTVNEAGDYLIQGIGRPGFGGDELTSILLQDNIVSVGISSFSNNNLTSVVLPDSLTTIDVSAFSNNSIEYLKLPANIESIGNSSFKNNKLTSLQIPTKPDGQIISIGEYTFQENLLTSVEISKNVTSLSRSAFADNLIESVVLPEGLVTVGAFAFENNAIKEVVFSSTVTTIGERAFENNLISDLILKDGIKVIESYAFDQNPITKLVIPDVFVDPNTGTKLSIGRFPFGNSVREIMIPSYFTALPESVNPETLETLILPGRTPDTNPWAASYPNINYIYPDA